MTSNRAREKTSGLINLLGYDIAALSTPPEDFTDFLGCPDSRTGGIDDQIADFHLRQVGDLRHHELFFKVAIAKVGGLVFLAVINVRASISFSTGSDHR